MGVPLYNNFGVTARRIAYGDCRMMFVGDSETADTSTPRLNYGIMRKWPVNWVGRVIPASAQASDESGQLAYASAKSTANNRMPDETFSDTSTNVWPVRAFDQVMTADQVNFGNIYTMKATVLDEYLGGDWTEDGPLRGRLIYDRTGNESSSIRVQVKRDTGTMTMSNTAGGIDLSSGDTGLATYDLDFSAELTGPATAVQINFDAGSADETGDQFHWMAVRFYKPGETGFELGSMSQGGWGTLDHLASDYDGGNADAKYTNAGLSDYLTHTNSNTFWVQLGQNQYITQAAYKAEIEAIVERYRTACSSAGISDPLFILVSNWQAGATAAKYEEISSALLEISQVNSDCAFFNQFQAVNNKLGDYATWSPTYLSDGVHPNTTGALEFAEIAWKYIRIAAQPPQRNRWATGRSPQALLGRN